MCVANIEKVVIIQKDYRSKQYIRFRFRWHFEILKSKVNTNTIILAPGYKEEIKFLKLNNESNKGFSINGNLELENIFLICFNRI